MKKSAALLLIISIVFSQSVELSGNIHYTETVGDHLKLNSNTQEDNPFHKLRSRLFLFSQVDDNISVDVEIVFDDFAQEQRWIWLHGAFLTYKNVLKDNALNLKIGKIPLAVGRFPNRINESENNLIGLPLAYHYRTLVDWNQAWDANSQIVLLEKRLADGYVPHSEFPSASPVAYEAIWDYGINFNGIIKDFEYSVQLTNGSVSNPGKNYHNKDGSDRQISGRAGYSISPELSIGVSGAYNRYLSTSVNIPDELQRRDFYQTLMGADLSFEIMTIKLLAEYYESKWDNLNPEGFLKAKTYFAELVYTLPFAPSFDLVARYDAMMFNQITVNDVSGSHLAKWDSDLTRIEGGFAYQINRNLKIKAVGQLWDFDLFPKCSFFALQTLVLF